MAKKNEIIVKDVAIKTMSKDGIDYISITDIARQKNATDPNGVIANWMRNRAIPWNFLVYGRLFTTQILTPSNSRGLEKRLV